MKRTQRVCTGAAAAALGAWLLLAPEACAQTASYNGTGWLVDVPAPGLFATNSSGQIFLKGGLQILRIDSSDPRTTGRRWVFGQAAFNQDGSAATFGYGYLEVGTWSGTNFTPSGPLWELQWSGIMSNNFSLQLSITGVGYGGNIEGWRLQESFQRGPALGPYDPPVPYQLAGTLQPPPASTIVNVSDFDAGSHSWYNFYSEGRFSIVGTNKQLHLKVDYNGVNINDFGSGTSWAAAPNQTWALLDGQTLECSADLLSVSQGATNIAGVYFGNGPLAYVFGKGPNFLMLCKWTGERDLAVYWLDTTTPLPATNLNLSLSLTRQGTSGILTARVLDKSSKSVVYERSFVDTPAKDATLTTLQVRQATGMSTFGATLDNGGPFFVKGDSGSHGVVLMQYTKGSDPAVTAVIDNFSMGIHETPRPAIAWAVQVSWVAPEGVRYDLESARHATGPYTEVQDIQMPGIKRVTVPAANAEQFFRLRRAP